MDHVRYVEQTCGIRRTDVFDPSNGRDVRETAFDPGDRAGGHWGCEPPSLEVEP